MDERIRQAVLALIAEARPATLLGIGPQPRDFYAPCLARDPRCDLTLLAAEDAPARLPQLGRFDFAFVAGALEHLPKTDAAALIARLRDLHARRLALAVGFPAARAWSHEELLAFGLTRVAASGDAALYVFDIAHYKQTPDWLNSDNWAHPELFDKYRW